MARSSFMGRRLDSCLHANHSLYRCRQERSGPGSRLGLKGPFILTQVVDCMIEKTNNLKQIIHYKLDQKIQHLFKYSRIPSAAMVRLIGPEWTIKCAVHMNYCRTSVLSMLLYMGHCLNLPQPPLDLHCT